MGSGQGSPRSARGLRKGYQEAKRGIGGRPRPVRKLLWRLKPVRRLRLLSRAEAFVYRLQHDLAEAARCHAIAAGIMGEMAAGQ